jgi:hypothetical protein
MAEHLGCNALIERMRTGFYEYVRQTWAPSTIARLDLEHDELQARCVKLGLPAAPTELSPAQLSTLRAGAIAAAERVLNESMAQRVRAAHEAPLHELQAKVAAAALAGGIEELGAWACEMREAAHETTLRAMRAAVAGVREALLQDESEFKLGRFPAYVDAIARVLERTLEDGHAAHRTLGDPQALRARLAEAAESLAASGWVEATAADRRQLEAQMAAIAPAKARIFELLGEVPQGADALATMRVERLVALARGGTDAQKESAAAALANLAADSADNQAAIARAGGIEPLVALARGGTDAQKESAAAALRYLARNGTILWSVD